MKKVTLLFWAGIFTLLSAVPGVAAPKKFRAELSGKNEVPRVTSPARGDLKLTLRGNEINFELNVKRITRPMAASIHRGKKGENGPPVAGLFGGPVKERTFSGILATGLITDKHLIGELEGKRVADLVRLIKSGEAYVNILTETYPAGEIRGQIR